MFATRGRIRAIRSRRSPPRSPSSGSRNPILIGTDDVVIAGHGRLLAAKFLGLSEVPVIVSDHLSDAQRRALVIADNRIADDPADLSTMGRDEFFVAYAQITAAAAARLAEDRFAVWAVGGVRDDDGGHVDLPGRTVDAFEVAGTRFSNDAILVTAIGSLPIRAGRRFTASVRNFSRLLAPALGCVCFCGHYLPHIFDGNSKRNARLACLLIAWGRS
jgi:hypothetical protein